MSWRAQCQVQCKWSFGGCWLLWDWTGSCGSSEVGEGQMLQGSNGQDGICLKDGKFNRHVRMLVLFYLLHLFLDGKNNTLCH